MSQIKIERRTAAIRAAQDEEFCLAGRALSYNEVSSNEIFPGMRERIIPGCFRASLQSGIDVKALLNHSATGLPLGRSANGTLVISDGPDGLDFKVQLDRNLVFHRDVFAAVKGGLISECSFAFQCEEDDFSEVQYAGQTCQVRNVRKAILRDCSIVNEPFYGDGATSVDARNLHASAAATLRKASEIIADSNRRSRAHDISMQMLKEGK